MKKHPLPVLAALVIVTGGLSPHRSELRAETAETAKSAQEGALAQALDTAREGSRALQVRAEPSTPGLPAASRSAHGGGGVGRGSLKSIIGAKPEVVHDLVRDAFEDGASAVDAGPQAEIEFRGGRVDRIRYNVASFTNPMAVTISSGKDEALPLASRETLRSVSANLGTVAWLAKDLALSGEGPFEIRRQFVDPDCLRDSYEALIKRGRGALPATPSLSEGPSWTLEPDGAGSISIPGDKDAARARLLRKIGELCASMNVAITSGESPAPGASFRLDGESNEAGKLTVEFKCLY